MNFSEGMFYEKYLTSDFHTNTKHYFKTCLPTRQKGVETVIRPVDFTESYYVILHRTASGCDVHILVCKVS